MELGGIPHAPFGATQGIERTESNHRDPMVIYST